MTLDPVDQFALQWQLGTHWPPNWQMFPHSKSQLTV
jgi:hypothetical protein